MAITVRRLITQFLQWADAALAPATVAAYKHQLGKIPPSVRRKQARRCRPIDLTRWAKTWHEAQALIRLFNWGAEEAKLFRSNPFATCRLPARGQRRRIVAGTALLKLLRTGKFTSRHFLLALRETLARPQEIRAAAWEQLQAENPETPIDVALIEGTALIVQHDYKDRRRRADTSRPRVLLVSKRLGRLISRIGKTTEDRTGPIFLNHRGRQWTRNAVRCLLRRIRRRLKIAADANGENVVAYTFRHSLATLAASKGITDRMLADLLGHVESRTTARYLHLQVGHLRAAMDRFVPDRTKRRENKNRSL